jgi:uncharacterized membrane protein required for colicin V production
MSVLVMAVAAEVGVVNIHDGFLTACMSVLGMMAAAMDAYDRSVDTVDWVRVFIGKYVQ